jgi:hypothetical protein
MCESGEQTAAQQFAKWESRIGGSAEAAICLDGLCAEQRKQLAALLIQTITDMEMRSADSQSSQWARLVRRDAPARLRVLNEKLQKARRAVEELRVCAKDSGAANLDDKSRHTARLLLGLSYGLAADEALKALTIKNPPNAQEFAAIANEHPTPERVEAFGMVQLYWFFRHGCGLSGDESEVRAARLRNAFWTEHSISRVRYRAEYVSGESKGCDTVHVAVTRFKLNQGYKPGADHA